jgi:hypothetical protein
MRAFKEESKSDDYDRARDRREVRMDYMASQILLNRNDVGRAEALIQKNVQITRKEHSKKMQGSFLELLAEVQVRRNEFENAAGGLNKAILILEEVGNPRQLWQAHASLAFNNMGRSSEAREHWGAAATVIRGLANGLSDRELKQGFLQAEPIRAILSNAEK